MKKNNNKKRQKKSSPAGCLFWVAVILLFIIIFFLNHKSIEEVISSTGFFELFKSETEDKPVEVERITGTREDPEENKVNEIIIKTEEEKKLPVPEIEDSEEKVVKPKIQEPDYNFRETKLYFISISSNGGDISLISINRKIKYTDSPLTATLNALLAGLTTSELNSGYISLIPDNTEISGVTISDGTAFINFNESFLFNPFGREGYVGQLKQVVFTATEYSTVKRVQFLIEGKKQKYLGSEGIFIGNPVSRNSFN